jgi:hypothetical protein
MANIVQLVTAFLLLVLLICTTPTPCLGYNSGTNWWNGNAFSALTQNVDGTYGVISWGMNDRGNVAPDGLTDVISIASTDKAFTALKRDGTIECWGDPSFGGTAPAGLSGIMQLFSTYYAFAALDSNGQVHTWGWVSVVLGHLWHAACQKIHCVICANPSLSTPHNFRTFAGRLRGK